MNLIAVALIACLAVASAQQRDERCPLNENPSRPTHLEHPTDCTRFFKCIRGIAHELQCPNNQHWSTAMNWCDTPSRAQCSPSRPMPVPQAPLAPQAPMAPQAPQRPQTPQRPMMPQFPGVFPGQQPGCGGGNCGGMPIQQPCGGGNCNGMPGQQWPNMPQVFPPQQQWPGQMPQVPQQPQPAPQWPQQPNWPQQPPHVPIHPELPMEPVRPSTPRVCPQFDTPGRHILFSHARDCNSFHQCIDGRPVTIQCPVNMHFNESTSSCDTPRNANCVNRSRFNEENADEE